MEHLLKHIRHFLLLGFLTSTYPMLYSAAPDVQLKKEVWIVVFVHGIMGIAPHINLQNIGLFVRDELVDTVYARAVNRMRKDTFFFKDQPMQDVGFLPIDLSEAQIIGNAAALFAYLYDRIDAAVSPVVHHNVFYTYGWSGLLSRYQRYIESEGLLLGLHQVVESYKAQGIVPKIRLIGYSHGGNVCLQLARMHEDCYQDMDIVIDELVLVGMPVQRESDIYVASPLFKRVYNIFSHQDMIQKLDFFSCNQFLSNRQFTSRRSFRVPHKVSQINIKVSRLKKSRMCREKMVALTQNGCATVNRSGQKRLLRDASPGHIELWLFGWTSDKYRDYFPLHPLPTALFIPYLINIAESYEDEIYNPHPCTIDLRPELGYTLVSQRTTRFGCFTYQIPFIDEALFQDLCDEAQAVCVTEMTKQSYQEHICTALREACKEYDTAKQPLPCKAKKGRHKYNRRKHKKARALPSHYKFLEPLS